MARPIVVDASDSPQDTTIAVYTGDSVNSLTLVASIDDRDGQTSTDLIFDALSGTTYHIAISSKEQTGGYLTVKFTGPPRQDLLVNATEFAGFPFSLSQDNSNATAEEGEPAHAGNEAARSLWMKVAADSGGFARIRTRGSQIDTVLAVYTSTVENPTFADLVPLVSNDDGNYGANWSEVLLDVSPGDTFWVAVDGKNGARGPIGVFGAFTPANDNFANAFPISQVPVSIPILPGNLNASTREDGEPNHDSANSINSLWWVFEAPQSGDYTIEVNDTAVLGLYTGTQVNALSTVASDESDGTENSRILLSNAIEGQRYHIAFAERPGKAIRNAEMTIRPFSSIANDNLASALQIPSTGDYTLVTPFSHTVDNTDATMEAGEFDTYASGGRSIWYQWTPSESGSYVLSGNKSQTEFMAITLFRLTGSLEDGLQHSDLQYITFDRYTGANLLPELTSNFVAGQTYFIQFAQTSQFSNDPGIVTFELYKFEAPANDNLADALEVNGLFAQREFYNTGASRQNGEPDHASTNWYYNDFRPHWVDDGSPGFWSVGVDIDRMQNTIWFQWTPEAEHIGNRTAVSTWFSSAATAIMVYEADAGLSSYGFADLQPVMALHPDPERVPQGATADAGFGSRESTHVLWNSDPNYPDMYPPDPDYNEAYPDNRDPDWRPGASYDFGNYYRYGEVQFIPEAGKTYFIVSGNGTSGLSSILRLSIWQTPNDHFADAQELQGTDIRVETANFSATAEKGEPFHYLNGSGNVPGQALPAGRTLWYRWTCPVDGVYTFDTYHSYLGWGAVPVPQPADEWADSQNWGGWMQLSIYTSASDTPGFDDLERVDSQTYLDYNMNSNAKMATYCTAGVTYYVALEDGAFGTLYGRNDYTFQEFGPKTEWGNRSIMALNIKQGTIEHDDFARAKVIPGDLEADPFVGGVYHELVDLAYAWNEEGEPDHAIRRPGYTKSVWYRWTPEESGEYWIGTAPDYAHHEYGVRRSQSDGNRSDVSAANVAVYQSSVPSPALTDLEVVATVTSDDMQADYVSAVAPFSAEAGKTYYIALAMEEHFRNFGNGAYYTGIQFGRAPANDAFANASPIVGHEVTVFGNNMGATEETNEPRIEPNWYRPGSSDRSVWWRWTAPGSGSTTISTYGSYMINEMGVFTGSSVDSLTQVALARTGQSLSNLKTYQERLDEIGREVTINATAGTTYYIKVNGGEYGRTSTGPITLSIQGQPGIPIDPSHFSFTRPTTNRVNFTWQDNAFDESAYVIERSVTGSGPWNEIFRSEAANATSGTDINADRGYQYRLRAEGDGGLSNWVYLDATVLGQITAVLPEAEVGSDYFYQMEGFAGTGNYQWSIISGKPSWLSLDASTGILSGVPDEEVPYLNTFVVELSDGNTTALQTLTLLVQGSINLDFQGWLTFYGLSDMAGHEGTMDDGYSLYLEFLLGGHPLFPEENRLVSIEAGTGGEVVLVFDVRKGYLGEITIEGTSDLQTWLAVIPASQSTIDQGNGFYQATLTFDFSDQPLLPRFLRLVAVSPN